MAKAAMKTEEEGQDNADATKKVEQKADEAKKEQEGKDEEEKKGEA